MKANRNRLNTLNKYQSDSWREEMRWNGKNNNSSSNVFKKRKKRKKKGYASGS